MGRGTSSQNKHHPPPQDTCNLVIHSVVLFYQELSGFRGSFVSLCFSMKDLRLWVISNFVPVFREA